MLNNDSIEIQKVGIIQKEKLVSWKIQQKTKWKYETPQKSVGYDRMHWKNLSFQNTDD